MADKMLIDASHEEETRVVVVRGNRIEEFDFESQHKKQLRGNIYLAKVTRVEPSLQAAFVEYGGNRHGFLAFSEIHPDYYQIPVADRQALLDAEAEEAQAEDDEGEAEKPAKRKTRTRRSRGKSKKEAQAAAENTVAENGAETDADETTASTEVETIEISVDGESTDPKAPESDLQNAETSESSDIALEQEAATEVDSNTETSADDAGEADELTKKDTPPDSIAAAVETDEISEAVEAKTAPEPDSGDSQDDDEEEEDDNTNIESVGAEDALEEVPDRARKPRKQYRIQEVIKRRQILLVQVVKEERGNKGAALTTYLSLAGRYSVLMPNTARGGGISRKITNVQDRKRLKEIARGLDVPQGMGVILRTAGANRTKSEIKRDFEYLMRLWENVRNLTLTSTAPCLVYEEGSLIKRSIRDLYNKDIGEVIVSGENGYREAKDFMKMLMPSHAKAVQPYREVQPIFARSGIESQLDKMLQPQVTLKSGGYIIINQTEALVAIDVNSGRSTKEHSIEDTAVRTNLEAAEEVARQLRLRDMAGLIVIDFIDMEEKRNNRAVEKKLKDCLKIDRARIQVGRISHFGLLEMSRQRIRASVLESTMQICELCAGTGYIRSDSSVALYVLRTAEEYLLRSTKHNISVRTMPDIALYLLNQKRDSIVELESRFGVTITVEADVTIGQQHVAIDQGEAVETPVIIEASTMIDIEFDEPADELPEVQSGGEEEGNGRKRKRRRRRRGGRGNGENADGNPETSEQQAGESSESAEAVSEDDGENRKKRRRRGKRGGKRNREQETNAAQDASDTSSAPQEVDQPAAMDASDTVSQTDQSDSNQSNGAMEIDSAPETNDAHAGSDEHEKPKRPRKRRAKKSDDAAVASEFASDVAVETVSTDEIAATVEEAPKRNRRRASSSDDTTSEPKVTSSTSPSESDDDSKPKKAGWWQRRGFF